MLFVGGDWNLVRNTRLDKSGGVIGTKEKSLEKLDDLMNFLEINDTWRVKNPSNKRFTWRQKTPLIQCRLDFFLTSDHIYDSISDLDIIPTIHSDHSAITLSFQTINSANRGPGFWKLNNSLLKDKAYIEEIRTLINSFKLQNTEITDKRLYWDFLKYEIKKQTIKFSKTKRQRVKTRQEQLEKRLIDLEKHVLQTLDEYEHVKAELKEIEREKIEGILVRSRIKWYEEGESSTKYFLRLEKQNSSRKHIQKLKLKSGREITDPTEILDEEKKFYEELYNAPVLSDNFQQLSDNFLGSPLIPRLTINLQTICEGQLSQNECLEALKTCSKNKSPGNDGITFEFYLTFWEFLKDPIVACFNESFMKTEMSVSQRQALITLIDKKGKDRLFLKNWRPISLLNNDYKLATKAITLRLKKVIHNLIHHDQSGFLDGRDISHSLRTVLDIIEITNRNNKKGMLMLVDFEKAFDTINITFLRKVLETYNFGPNFRQWVNTFYTNISSCIVNNQTSSAYFNIKRGVRQGDPLSSYLFILVVEILSINVRNDKNIRGVSCQGTEIKLVQYADDTTRIFKDVESANNFLQMVNTFSEISGLKLNVEKTEAIWLGSDKNRKEKPLGIKWPDKPIKLLGLYIGHNDKDLEISNFRHKLIDLKRLLHSWEERDLSIIGRILVVKSLAVSKFVYLFNLISFPLNVLKEIENSINEFVWKGKAKKVKHNVFIQDYKYGGCKMYDIMASLKAQQLKWIKQYLNNTEGVWRHTMEESIGVKF